MLGENGKLKNCTLHSQTNFGSFIDSPSNLISKVKSAIL